MIKKVKDLFKSKKEKQKKLKAKLIKKAQDCYSTGCEFFKKENYGEAKIWFIKCLERYGNYEDEFVVELAGINGLLGNCYYYLNNHKQMVEKYE